MLKKEKITLIVGIAILFLVLGSSLFFLSEKNSTEKSPPLELTEETSTETAIVLDSMPPIETKKEVNQNKATLEINGVPFTANIKNNTSVYDFMRIIEDEGNVQFKDKTYIGLGKFIDEINGVRGDGSRFWIYYVNGQKAKIGVSNYRIKGGDVVSWKYEKDLD